MVKVDKTHEERRQKNLEISDIIDETIADYAGLPFFRNSHADPSDPDNWLYSDTKETEMIFNGELRKKHYVDGRCELIVMGEDYFDWAMEVAEKIGDRLGLDVTLKELYD